MTRLNKTVTHFSVAVGRDNASHLIDALGKAGLTYVNTTAARKVRIFERHGLSKMILGGTALVDSPVSMLTFITSGTVEKELLSCLIEKGGFDIQGRGSVFTRSRTLVAAHEECMENPVSLSGACDARCRSDLMGICCIVQKSEGNMLGRVGLDTGSGVPVITFGEGTGLRDKLGLWRITIPAEKEIVNLVVTRSDAESIMDMMISTGGLDQPGRGFIYVFPVNQGMLDSQIHLGVSSQAASVEQIISAIDEIKGGTDWRRRELSIGGAGQKKRRYLENLVNLTLICNEGRAMDLIGAAMNAGASGGTVSKIRHLFLVDAPQSKISAAREKAEMIVSETQVNVIVDALDKAGAFDDETCGEIITSPVPKACTFLGK